MRALFVAALLGLAPSACLESRDGPPLLPQARISYGTRVYVADAQGFPPPSSIGICTRMTTTVETFTGGSTSTPSALADLITDPGFVATDGAALDDDDLRRPQTCFVPIVDDNELDPDLEPNSYAGTLLVDRFEVTNDLFQFCVDSGFCSEPDPSKADQNDVCREEGEDNGYFDCPLVEVSQLEARRFCQYIGRRLPTSLESLMIRQAAWEADPATGTREPENLRLYPAQPVGGEPAGCPDAHLGAFSCGRPNPFRFGSSPSGSAQNDEVVDSVLSSEPVFDLTGHVAEWSSDGFPGGTSRPWFCLAEINRDEDTGRPECPELELENPDGSISFRTGCVHGYYDPDDLASNVVAALFDDGLGDDPAPGVDLPYGLYPVCAIGNTGRFAGSQGFLFGGNWQDDALEPELAGVFGRRVEATPAEPEDSTRAQGYGLRCVDDREPGLDDSGAPFPFDSVPEGGDEPGLQIDVDFLRGD